MTQIEQDAAIQAQNDIIRDREGRLKATDYVEHKIVDAICLWAKGDRPTVAGLVSSILALVGDNGEYKGFPESKDVLRADINAAESSIKELEGVEVENEKEESAS